jgi:hypothetical protein
VRATFNGGLAPTQCRSRSSLSLQGPRIVFDLPSETKLVKCRLRSIYTLERVPYGRYQRYLAVAKHALPTWEGADELQGQSTLGVGTIREKPYQ